MGRRYRRIEKVSNRIVISPFCNRKFKKFSRFRTEQDYIGKLFQEYRSRVAGSSTNFEDIACIGAGLTNTARQSSRKSFIVPTDSRPVLIIRSELASKSRWNRALFVRHRGTKVPQTTVCVKSLLRKQELFFWLFERSHRLELKQKAPAIFACEKDLSFAFVPLLRANQICSKKLFPAFLKVPDHARQAQHAPSRIQKSDPHAQPIHSV